MVNKLTLFKYSDSYSLFIFIKEFLNELSYEYDDSVYFSNIRWQMFKAFFVYGKKYMFMNERKESAPELSDDD